MAKGTHVLCVILCILPLPVTSNSETTFNDTTVNITVHEGETAVLPCSVTNIGDYKVSWFDPMMRRLTIEDTLFKKDDRISVERPYIQNWNLQIRSVRSTDGGAYRCCIDKTPFKIKTINLVIQVAARIVTVLYSSDVTAIEAETIAPLRNATESHMPTVTGDRHPPNGNEKKEGTYIYIGTGIGLAVLLAAVIGVSFILKRRSVKKRKAEVRARYTTFERPNKHINDQQYEDLHVYVDATDL